MSYKDLSKSLFSIYKACYIIRHTCSWCCLVIRTQGQCVLGTLIRNIEGGIRSKCSLIHKVPQVDSKFIDTLRGEEVEVIIAKPEVFVDVPKTLFVIIPVQGKINTSIPPPLKCLMKKAKRGTFQKNDCWSL